MVVEEIKKILKSVHKADVEKDAHVEDIPFDFSFIKAKTKSKPEFPVSHLKNRFTDVKARECFDLVYVFEGFVKRANSLIYTFSIPERSSFRDVAFALCKNTTSMKHVFFLTRSHVLLEKGDTDLIKGITSFLDTGKYAIVDIGMKLGELDFGRNLCFFDGEHRLELEVSRRLLVYDFRSRFFLDSIQTRLFYCKVCNASPSTTRVIDDPILPENRRLVCDGCFKDLFVGTSGSLRYAGIQYKALDTSEDIEEDDEPDFYLF